MSDLIRREDAIDALKKYEELESNNFTDTNPISMMTVATIANCIEEIVNLPSAEPEQKNRKTALSVQVKVEFDDMKALLEDIGNLQTYKLFEGDDMVLVNIKDIKDILTKYVKAKEVQPERTKGSFIGTEYDGYADGEPVYYEWKCSECGCVFEDDEPTYNFCPNCGADMRGE